jgi:hypothetical protein
MRGSAARRAGALHFGALSGATRCLGMALLAVLLGACSRHLSPQWGGDEGLNPYPTNYKSDILGAMHAYLNDPTGIRDAALSEPTLKTIANRTRYVACVKFNGKRNGSKDYAGNKEIAAVFVVGRFDQFIDSTKEANAKDLCAGVTYAPFPELQTLPP